MKPYIEKLVRQSNKGNWSYQAVLRGESNVPLWTTSPLGVVVSLVAVDRKGAVLFQTSSGDGTGQISLGTNGIVNIDVLPDMITAADEGMYDMHITVVSGGFTINRVFGRLPIYEGFTITSSTSGGSAVGPTIQVWQLKVALINSGDFATVEAAISPATDNKSNVIWTSGGDTTLNDALSELIQGILGWSSGQMATLYADASGILSVA